MTTNAYCRAARLMASDSRWSYKGSSFYLYVDDTGFDKIDYIPGKAGFLFAGDSEVIAKWKAWIYSSPASLAYRPEVKAISVCIVNEQTGEFQEWHGNPLPNAWFAGTGSAYAIGCWAANKDAMRAIETAKGFDPQSGGTTKFYDLGTKSHNLSMESSVKVIGEALLKRGMVMYRKNGIAPAQTPIADVIGSDAEVRAVCEQIEQGAISASAPCPGAMQEWSAEEEKSLNSALADIFGMAH